MALLEVCRELGLDSLPVVTQMDFGHTDPMFVIPYGVEAEIDCDRQQLRYTDPLKGLLRLVILAILDG